MCPLGIDPLPCRPAVGGQGEGGERLAEDIAAALDDRLPRSGDPEEVASIHIDAVVIDEGEA